MNTNKIILAVGGGLVVLLLLFLVLGGKKSSQITQTNQNTNSMNQVSITPQKFERGPEVIVTLSKSGFDPQTVTIKPGTRVIWMNKSGETATVNSDVHPTHKLYSFLNMGTFDNGSSVQVIFDKAGTYTYHDHLNPNRTGKVIVQ